MCPELKWSKLDYKDLLPKRAVDAHKGIFGSCLVIAGSMTYMGAAILTAKAALRTGVGLVHLIGPESWQAAIVSQAPELIYHPIQMPSACFEPTHLEMVKRIIDSAKISVLAIGPGLGLDPLTGQFLRDLLPFCEQVKKKVLLDADALRLLKSDDLKDYQTEIVITPHPKEASLFFSQEKALSQEARLSFAKKAIQDFPHTLVLKGYQTIIAQKKPNASAKWIGNSSGNSGLATAGSGDVLAGIIAALMAQGKPAFESAALGVFCHGLSADLWIKKQSERALVASDIIDNLGTAFFALEKKPNSGVN